MKAKILAAIIGIFIMAFAAYAQAEASSSLQLEVLAPKSGALISQANGNYKILFKIFDTNTAADINASLYYTDSSTKTIVENLKLKTQGNCSSTDWTTRPVCYFDWNTSGINTAAQSFNMTAQDLNSGWAMAYIFGITIDNTAPSGLSILINNGASISSNPELNLALAASADANQMQFSCDNSSYSAWENFASTASFNVYSEAGCNSTDGTKTVYFKVKDIAGNISASVSDSILLDSTAPSISITQPLNGAFDNDSRKQVKASLSDNLSGINASTLKFSLNGTQYPLGNYSGYSLIFASDSNALTFTPKTDYNNQTYNVRIDLNDFANNSATQTSSFTIDKNSANAINGLNGAVQGDMTITLVWDAPFIEGAGISNYKIYKSSAPIIEESKAAAFYNQTSNTYFTDSQIAKGNTYHYYVTTVDLAGNESKLSNEKSLEVEGFVKLSADKNSIIMQEGTSYGIELTLFNDTKESKNIAVNAFSDDSQLRAELGIESPIRLNKNERTTFSLSLIAEESVDSGSHLIEIEVDYGNGSIFSYFINVTIGESDFTSFDLLDQTICNDESTIRIPVEVSNISSSSRYIELSAANNVFLPSWDESSVRLDSGESRTIDLLLHNSPSSGLEGDFTIQVTARSGSRTAVQELEFSMENCDSSSSNNFTLNTDYSTISLYKNENRRISYRVTNNSDNDQYLNISIESDLHSDYNSVIFVRGNAPYYDTAVIRADVFQEPKRYELKITASNSEITREKTISVNVQKTHYFQFQALENSFEITQNNEKEIILEFKNADYSENFTVGLDNNDSGINASLSENSFTMNASSTKQIILKVNAKENASLGSKAITVNARTGNVSTKTTQISFNVKEQIPLPETLLLEVESYPIDLQIMPGKTKELNFIIYNPSKNTAIATIEFLDLPEGITLEEEISEAIAPKARKTITAVLKASNNAEIGEFEIPARIEAFGIAQTKRISLKVGESGFLTGIISGFLSLAESVWLGVLALIVIIVVLILIGSLGKEQPKETWVQK